MLFFRTAVAVALFALSAAAGASPITWTFSGTINVGRDVGKFLSGTITIDPSLLTAITTDGSTYNNGNQIFRPPYPTGLLSGSATVVGGPVFNVSGGTSSEQVDVGVYKNYGAARNQNQYGVYGNSANVGGLPTSIQLNISDSNGNASTIFSQPGLGLSQPVNWSAPGARVDIVVELNNGAYIDEVTAGTVSAVPLPGALGLFAAGLFATGLVARKRPA
jgi:hypothetical protein